MTCRSPLSTAVSAIAILLAAGISSAAWAQSSGAEEATANGQNSAAQYRDHVGRTVADENWYEIERRGYQAQRARPNFEVRTVDDLTVYQQRDLDRQGRVAQRARGARLATTADSASVKPRGAASPTTSPPKSSRAKMANGKMAYAEHAARIGTDKNWHAVEDRGVRAQRGRPGFEVRGQSDLTPKERFELDNQGRHAQRARGTRLPTQPVSASYVQRANPGYPGTSRLQAGKTDHGLHITSTRTSYARRAGGSMLRAANNASNVDFAAQAFGGRELGATRYASDMTIGQFSNALRGGDPVALATRSTRRLGSNFESGLIGIGQSVRDPRRIPGNVGRAVTGAGKAAVDTTRWVGETAVKGVRDGARMASDPRYAVKKVGEGVRNVGQSMCKGLSYLIPGASKKQCR